MKRILLTAVAVTALALPVIALGDVRGFAGPDEDGGTVSFDVKFKQHEPTRVIGFTWQDVPMHCTQPGPKTTHGRFQERIAVNSDGEFHSKGTTTGQFRSTARVTGEFRHQGRKARGTLDVHGDLGPGLTGCHTHTDDWHAER